MTIRKTIVGAAAAAGAALAFGGGASAQTDPVQMAQQLGQVAQIWCQQGNQQACQMAPGYDQMAQQMWQAGQMCQQGDQQACGYYEQMSQSVVSQYQQVANAQAAAGQGQYNDPNDPGGWQAHQRRMDGIAATGAAGTAAHNARQQSNEAQYQAWRRAQGYQ